MSGIRWDERVKRSGSVATAPDEGEIRGSGGNDTFFDEEPFRPFAQHLLDVARDAAGEIEVAADQLLERGWPVSRFRLYTSHDGDVTKTQLVLTGGAEFARDQVVFECRRETVYGPLVDLHVTVTTRLAGYWIVPLAQLTPHATTIAPASCTSSPHAERSDDAPDVVR